MTISSHFVVTNQDICEYIPINANNICDGITTPLTDPDTIKLVCQGTGFEPKPGRVIKKTYVLVVVRERVSYINGFYNRLLLHQLCIVRENTVVLLVFLSYTYHK